MRAPNPSTALAQTFLDEFIRCGVRHACISPGSRSAPLALAAAARNELQKHVLLDERSASFFALGIAKAAGVPALLICTSGTAAANFLPAIHEANKAGVPMLILTADRPPELRMTGANQATDQIKMFGDAVRSFVEVGPPEELNTSNMYWRSVAARAFSDATAASAGPVHLNIALREPLVPVESGGEFPFDLEGRPDGAPWHREITLRSEVSDEVVQRVSVAERGLIVAGHLKHGGSAVADLAAALGWPLVAEATSGARRPGISLDHYDLILESETFVQEHRPDLVLRFGSVGLSKNLARLLGEVPQILVDGSPTWHDAGRTAEIRVRSSAEAFCVSIAAGLPGAATSRDWAASWQQAAHTAAASLRDQGFSDALHEPAAASALVAAAPSGASILVGASMPIRDVDNFAAARDDVKMFANRGLNGIDGFVSTTRGIAAASKTSTFALCGDLTFLHDQGGLLDAARRGFDVTFVVLNNNGGGIFSFLPQAKLPEHFEEVFGTPQDVDLALLCKAHGVEHRLAAEVSELEEELKRTGGVRVIEVRTDRDENVALHARFREAVKKALG